MKKSLRSGACGRIQTKMIKDGIVNKGDIIFVYSQPPESALVGIVEKIEYPILSVNRIARDTSKDKKNKLESVNISDRIALTILDDGQIKMILTPAEKKRLRKTQKEAVNVIDDIFA